MACVDSDKKKTKKRRWFVSKKTLLKSRNKSTHEARAPFYGSSFVVWRNIIKSHFNIFYRRRRRRRRRRTLLVFGDCIHHHECALCRDTL